MKSRAEKMKILLSKIDEGTIYSADENEKQFFFKFHFEEVLATRREIYVNLYNDINKFRDDLRTKIINDNLAVKENAEGYVIRMQLQGLDNGNSTAHLINVKDDGDEAKEKLSLRFGWPNKDIDFKKYLSQNNEILITIKHK